MIAEPLPTTAADLVLNTVELLELILRQLEPADQATSHQICKTWQNLINGSAHIYHRTFPWNKPIETADYFIWEPEVYRDSSMRLRTTWYSQIVTKFCPSAIPIGRLNPVFRDLSATNTHFNTVTTIEIPFDRILGWKYDFWRKQQIAQPPVSITDFRFGVRDFSESTGTTLGDLYDVLHGFARKGYQTGPDYGNKKIWGGIDTFVTEDDVDVKEARQYAATEKAGMVKASTSTDSEA